MTPKIQTRAVDTDKALAGLEPGGKRVVIDGPRLNDEQVAGALAAARFRIAAATRELEAAQAERLEALNSARAAGWPLRKVADALGVSFARVAQLEQGKDTDG